MDTNEIWKAVPGYEGAYDVSDSGRVYTHRRKKLVSVYPGPTGYMYVCLFKDGVKLNRRIHRLVLLAFVGPCPDGMEGCHNNGIRDDNRLSNLRWGTRAENEADKITHNTGHHLAKLDVTKAREIRVLLDAGISMTKIASRYGVHRKTIANVKNGTRWRVGPKIIGAKAVTSAGTGSKADAQKKIDVLMAACNMALARLLDFGDSHDPAVIQLRAAIAASEGK